MAKALISPKVSVTLDMARIMSINIETNPCKHGLGSNHQYIDCFVVWGRMVDGVFAEQMDPETHAIAQYYRVTDGCNPHSRLALPGMDPSSDGAPLGRCDEVICLAWQDRGLGELCPDCETGTVQPYDGFTRAGSAVIPNLYEFYREATLAFSGQPGAQEAFAAGGDTLGQALDSFIASQTFYGLAMQRELYSYKTISNVIYDFLISEIVPHPVTGEMKVLLEAE